MTKRKAMNSWYSIEALADDRRAEIHIMEQIGEDFWTGEGMTAKKFVQEVKGLDVDVIDLHINSPGGSVFDGQAIYNLLRSHRATVHVYIDGLAASIASVIAMAGDTVTMPRNAMMMIHDPSGYARGTSKDMRKTAEALDKVKKTIVAAYRDKTSLADETLAEMMSEETWMTAEEAMDLGFADRMAEPVDISACADFGMLDRYENVPLGLLLSNHSPARHKTKEMGGHAMADKRETPEITLDLIRAEHPAIVEAIALEAEAKAQAGHEAVLAKAKAEAAQAERERIKNVREQLIPGHEALIEALMFDGATTGPEAAVKVLQAERELRRGRIDDMRADGKLEVPAALAGDAAPKTGSVEDRAKAAWDKDDKVQAEFNNNFKSYLAWYTADVARKEA